MDQPLPRSTNCYLNQPTVTSTNKPLPQLPNHCLNQPTFTSINQPLQPQPTKPVPEATNQRNSHDQLKTVIGYAEETLVLGVANSLAIDVNIPRAMRYVRNQSSCRRFHPSCFRR